jgi:hypothetical protein
VIKSIVHAVVAQGGRFLKLTPDKKYWEDVSGDNMARVKVAHAVRDAATFGRKRMVQRSLKLLAANVPTSSPSKEKISLFSTSSRNKNRSDKGVSRRLSDDFSNCDFCTDDSSLSYAHSQEATLQDSSTSTTTHLLSSHIMMETHKHSRSFRPLEQDTDAYDASCANRDLSPDSWESDFVNPDYQMAYDLLKQAIDVCNQDDGIASVSWLGDKESLTPLTGAEEFSLFAWEYRI